MNEKQLHAVVESIEKYIQGLTNEFSDYFENKEKFTDISTALHILSNRSKEYRTPSFLALVVGPVKSGKSTFVNLLANAYVSPTHFLECTVRPSFIFRSVEDEAESITIYKSSNPENKAKQIEAIIDSLNGLTNTKDILEVEQKKVNLTQENIEKYVALDMVKINQDDTLMTSIKTTGGKLLCENVFIVDMAGFDGANVNLTGSPIYSKIVERADLIIFVQSSNSAISKVSSDFFELLKQKNPSAPVCLIHNIFESAYWRNNEEIYKDIISQNEYALETIQMRGIALSDANAYNINLGKVYDYRNNKYKAEEKKTLAKEEEEFIKLEESIFELLLKRRDTIRIKNCINRTKKQINILDSILKEELKKSRFLEEKYAETKKEFEHLKKTEGLLNISTNTQLELTEILSIVARKYDIIFNALAARYSAADARQELHRFVDNTRDKITEIVKEYFQNLTEEIINDKNLAAWKNEIDQLAVKHKVTINFKFSPIRQDLEVKFTNSFSEIDTLAADFAILNHWRRYTHDEMDNFLRRIKENMEIYITEDLFPTIQKDWKKSVKNLHKRVVDTGNIIIEDLEQKALAKIIPNYEQSVAEQKELTSLQSKLENMIFPTT